MPSKRIERANSELQRCLADIIQNRLNDPRLSKLIYVSEVSVTPDFKYCKIKISLDSPKEKDKETTLAILRKSEGFIKRELAEMVQMPQVPKLIFDYDKGADATIRIEEILKNLNIPKGEE